jgi:antitoxin (DNA-binding transcriptional repressor) of toxin-antitoxin stability system
MSKKRGGTDLVREPVTEYRLARTISASEAARNFSDLLNRIQYRGEAFVVERSGAPVCELRPVSPQRFSGADLLALLKLLPPVDEEFFDTLEEITQQQPDLPESPWDS